MCGIFGWQLREASPSLPVVATALAYANDLRGGDSWGVYQPEKNRVRKGIGRITHSGIHVLSLPQALMGHTRKATTGTIKKGNAHPFVIGNIVGAHNGIVFNHKQLNRAYKRNYQVDSMHIFAHLNEAENLTEIDAYGAVEFVYRSEPDKIYLGSFNKGDLAIAETDRGLFWSSSDKELRAALKLAGVSYKTYRVLDDTLYYAENGTLYEAGDFIFAPPSWGIFDEELRSLTCTGSTLSTYQTQKQTTL